MAKGWLQLTESAPAFMFSSIWKPSPGKGALTLRRKYAARGAAAVNTHARYLRLTIRESRNCDTEGLRKSRTPPPCPGNEERQCRGNHQGSEPQGKVCPVIDAPQSSFREEGTDPQTSQQNKPESTGNVFPPGRFSGELSLLLGIRALTFRLHDERSRCFGCQPAPRTLSGESCRGPARAAEDASPCQPTGCILSRGHWSE
jgi:hypothetical protein